jgi:hypothetical protein
MNCLAVKNEIKEAKIDPREARKSLIVAYVEETKKIFNDFLHFPSSTTSSKF